MYTNLPNSPDYFHCILQECFATKLGSYINTTSSSILKAYFSLEQIFSNLPLVLV